MKYINKMKFKYTVVVLAVTLIAQMFSVTSFAKEDKSVDFVKHLSDSALMSLTKGNITRPERENRVREIFKTNFDVETIGRFALGTYWRDATDAQKAEYMKLFENMVVGTYTTRFESYSGQSLKVEGAVETGKGDTIVSSKVVSKDNTPPLNIDWRLRSKDGELRIIDVVVEGISMSVTQRSDFAAVIQRGGGKIDALLQMLHNREKAPEKAAAPAKK